MQLGLWIRDAEGVGPAIVAVDAEDEAHLAFYYNDYTWLLFGRCRPTSFFLGPCQQQLLIQCRFAKFSELEARGRR